jgi:hypothetical protein
MRYEVGRWWLWQQLSMQGASGWLAGGPRGFEPHPDRIQRSAPSTRRASAWLGAERRDTSTRCSLAGNAAAGLSHRRVAAKMALLHPALHEPRREQRVQAALPRRWRIARARARARRRHRVQHAPLLSAC